MNIILEKDILNLIHENKYFDFLSNKSILISGATGLIGSVMIKSIIKFNLQSNTKTTIYAVCRNKEKYSNTFDKTEQKLITPIFSDIIELNISDLNIDYIVHGASITDSKTFIEKPVETISIAIEGTANLLKQCINKNIQGFVYLSSLEIYGTFNDFKGIKNVTENDLGYIDILSVRASYSESKRMVENICKAYSSEYNIPVKIARLCQTFGAGVSYNDNRVFAQFARSIIEQKDITLKTKGETIRNYCYITDAVSGILTVLNKGFNSEAYNVANMSTTISIADWAKKYCDLYPAAGSNVIFDISEDATKLGYNPVVQIQLDSTKLSKLGWNPQFNLDDMIINLVEGMKIEKNN